MTLSGREIHILEALHANSCLEDSLHEEPTTAEDNGRLRVIRGLSYPPRSILTNVNALWTGEYRPRTSTWKVNF